MVTHKQELRPLLLAGKRKSKGLGLGKLPSSIIILNGI